MMMAVVALAVVAHTVVAQAVVGHRSYVVSKLIIK